MMDAGWLVGFGCLQDPQTRRMIIANRRTPERRGTQCDIAFLLAHECHIAFRVAGAGFVCVVGFASAAGGGAGGAFAYAMGALIVSRSVVVSDDQMTR